MIRREATKRPRIGFTLIELLVVITIIGILIALLLPVVVGAVRKAREARIAAEIQTIAMGLAKFKDMYGEFPPSRVVLSESGNYSASGTNSPTPLAADFSIPLTSSSIAWYGNVNTANMGNPDISFGELAQRSLRILRKMYPRAYLRPVDLNNDNSIDVNNDYWPDYNGNAGISTTAPDPGFMYLEGHECLVFFLGGIPVPTSNTNGSVTYGTSGFGKEPLFPFKNNGVSGSNISTSNRISPSYEFKGERLVDDDGDGMPGYLDGNATGNVGTYYAYFASYGATGYDPNDVNSGEQDDAGNPAGSTFRVGLPVAGNTTFSPTPNPYTTSLPTPIGAGGFNAAQPAAYINPNSFQIISSGADGVFGAGGQWLSGSDRLPIPPAPPYPYDQSSLRRREDDNIANFTSGRLN